VSGGGYGAVIGNTIKNAVTTDSGTLTGIIVVLGGGVTDPLDGFDISDNLIWNTATHANQAGIIVQRGTSTSDHKTGGIVGNVVRGVRNGISVSSLLDGSIVGNSLTGDGVTLGSGILFGGSAQVKRLAIHSNNISGYNARTVSLTTNGPITDQSAEADLNVVGWNTQNNAHVLGVTGRIDFADLDATPSVGRPAGIYVISYSTTTTITQLDDGTIGQEATLFFERERNRNNNVQQPLLIIIGHPFVF
jgi:hypothetical protein